MRTARTTRHPFALTRLFVLTAAAVIGLPGASHLLAQRAPAPTQNALAGAAVFGEKGCVRCHSISGAGGSIGPDLTSDAGRPFQDLTAAMWNHIPDMSRRMGELQIERPHLTAREAGDLFAYVYTLGYFGAEGDAGRGAEIFTEARCIICHQVGGKGGVVGPVLDHVGDTGAPIEIAAAMWNHAPAMAREAESRGILRPRLTGRDLTDLLAFLGEDSEIVPSENLFVLPGSPEAGREILTERKCVLCHGAPGAGGGTAPDLAAVSRGIGLIDFVALMWAKTPPMIEALEDRGIEFPRLDAGDFADIVAYLYAANYFADAGRPERGASLLESKGCTDCHDRRSLVSIPGLSHPASVTAALWNHLATPAVAERADSGWPSFTGREMGDLMAFFQTRAP